MTVKELNERVNELCGEITKLNDKIEWILQRLKEEEPKKRWWQR